MKVKRLGGFIALILLLFVISNTLFAIDIDNTHIFKTSGEVYYLSVNEKEIKDLLEQNDFQILGYTNILKKKDKSRGEPDTGTDSPDTGNNTTYTVQPGDSLYLIAVSNNTTVQAIMDLNNLESDVIYVGQELLIPGKPGNETPVPDNPDTGNNTIYTVQPGDSLYLIAVSNNTTVQAIMDLNNLESDVIYVGQELLIPGKPGNETPVQDNPDTGNNTIYTVQPGDSLYLIAVRNNTTVQAIMDLNNLELDVIYVGQELLIPEQIKNETPVPDNPDNENQDAGIVYFVRSGDSLYLIANKFETTVDKIMEINHLPSYTLYVDQMLYITLPTNESKRVIYFVQPGDNLEGIAGEFDTTAEELKQLNNLQIDTLLVDQKLYIELPNYDNKNYNLILNYQVEAGKNLLSIANKFNLSPWEIRIYNNLHYDVLTVGQELEIPLAISEEAMGIAMTVNQDELKLLARAVHSEARGEPFNGQVAVAAVILNRVRSSLFPNTIEEVIFQPWQFTAIDDGQFWLEPDQTSYLAAKAALSGWDPSGGALFYYNPDTATDDWIYYRDVIVKIGDHYFAVSI